MAGQRNKQKPIKIIAATSMTLFSLFACFMGTFAWFNANRTITQSGVNMQIEKISTCLTGVTFHDCVGTKTVTENNESVNYYLFDQESYASITVSDDTPSALTFNTNSGAYKDWLAKDDRTATLATYNLLSQDHPILLLFNIASYTSSNPPVVALKFKTNRSYLGFADTIVQSGNPLSSVVEFKAFGLTGSLPSGGSYSSATQTYSATFQYGIERQIEYDRKWASISSSEVATFDSDGVLDMFSNLDVNGVPSNTVYSQIAVVMNYNKSSLEYIYNHFLGNSVLDDNLYFDWDWVMEI